MGVKQKKQEILFSGCRPHKVDGFFVGSNNLGFDTGANAQAYFAPVIAAVKSVYSGPVGYEAFYNNSVFGMVNIVDYQIMNVKCLHRMFLPPRFIFQGMFRRHNNSDHR